MYPLIQQFPNSPVPNNVMCQPGQTHPKVLPTVMFSKSPSTCYIDISKRRLLSQSATTKCASRPSGRVGCTRCCDALFCKIASPDGRSYRPLVQAECSFPPPPTRKTSSHPLSPAMLIFTPSHARDSFSPLPYSKNLTHLSSDMPSSIPVFINHAPTSFSSNHIINSNLV